MLRNRRIGLLLTMIVAAPPVLGGCTGKPAEKPIVQVAPSPAAPPAEVALTPAAGAKAVPVSAEISTTVTGGSIVDITLSDEKGARIKGTMRPDGTSWVPARPLTYGRAYTAGVLAMNEAGKFVTEKSTFTTMAKPTKLTYTTVYFADGMTYGVAMPVTVNFDTAVPKKARAAVQRRLFVTTEPPQPGAWHWLDGGTEVFYRAPDYWKPGTKISVRAALGGLPMGEGRYGDADYTAKARIGKSVFLHIDNSSKQMKVMVNGKLKRKIPVSMGKSKTPTSSGKMVIMEKYDRTTFDTRNDPDGGYVVTVANAQRLTWGGEFIHAAPWSVGDQGRRNVSHGCTNVSNGAAAWLMGVTHVGDLVTIKGTEVDLEPGNGWTAWNLTWKEFVKGSALPVPADLLPAAQKKAAEKKAARKKAAEANDDRTPTPVPSAAPAPEPSASGR